MTNGVEQAGRRIGRFIRFLTLGFFTSAIGLGVSAGVADSWRIPILWMSVAITLLCCTAMVMRVRRATSAAWGVYVALVAIGSLLQAQEPRPDAALIGIAVGTIVAGVLGVVLIVRIGRESRELERLLFTEATSMAFFVTMISALSYALLEAWVEAPRLSMWFVWTVGIGAWIIAATIFKRRYS